MKTFEINIAWTDEDPDRFATLLCSDVVGIFAEHQPPEAPVEYITSVMLKNGREIGTRESYGAVVAKWKTGVSA